VVYGLGTLLTLSLICTTDIGVH